MGLTHPRFERGKAITCCVFLALAGATEAAGDELLKDSGLERSGSFYVLGSEAAVHTKMDEAQTKFEPLARAFKQMAAIAEAEVQRKALEFQRTMLRRRIDDINVQLGRYPIPRLRNNFQRDDCNLLQDERDSAQLALNEINSRIGILNNQAATPKQKQELQAELERLRGPFQDAIHEARVVVDKVRKTYDDLVRNSGVKNALEMQRRSAKTNLKLGPSPEFQADVALLQEYERLLGPSPSNVGSKPKAKANNRRKVR